MSGFLFPLLAGALLNLDRRAFLQSMCGRPLMTGAVVGSLAGLPAQGLALGLWSELLWFWTVPVGGSHTPNPGLAVSAGIIALEIFLVFHPRPPEPSSLVSLVFVLVPAAAWLLILQDRLNRRLAGRIVGSLRESILRGEADPPFFSRNLAGLLETFLLSLAFLSAAALFLSGILFLAAAFLPPSFFALAARLHPLAPLTAFLGVAAFLSRGSFPPYLAGLSVGALVLILSRL
ncbi:MAG: PTS sugar transporter subunit IIC [Deltaproteobacteria bacterium]|nr:PTS sugar transporter subunit IIC [Deltaproteobacteria bacterium]